MVWVAENIQACLRIFRRAQHQWLVRDILHLPQGVFYVFVLWHTGPIRLIRPIRVKKESWGQEGLSLFIALRWMQEPCGVMMGLTENIQACLRIFRRAQHLWLVRDILYERKGFLMFLSYGTQDRIRSIRLIRSNPC